MRFSLQDIPKSVRRQSGNLSLSLHFLQPGEIEGEIAQLVAFHEQHLGQPQRLFSIDDARSLIGDYRMANCLLATISNWYRWQTRSWEEALQQYDHTGQARQLLNSADINSPTQLRLALYSIVNQQYHGFLSTQARTAALTNVAGMYQLERDALEYLLALDTDNEAMLVREGLRVPSAQEISTLYNQWAFEAALFSASQVQFVIDYTAFARLSLAEEPARTVSTGVGSVIKRLCYLARKLGVYYDLEYKEDESHLLLTLYGPQEVTGRAQQYGLRLARLCRLLLGYALTARGGRTPSRNTTTLSAAIVNAQATVHMLQRTYTFAITPAMLHLLHITATPPTAAAISGTSELTTTDNPATELFDSSIEQHLAEAFSALATNQHLHGWHLEREPEPLLLPHGIFIPDFAFTRDKQRIYVEILGFWTPAYRERKLQKLHYLRERGDIVLALPREAESVFAPLAPHFPLVLYDEQLSITDLLKVLQQRYDDFAERLAALDYAAIQAQVKREELLSEQRCYTVLHCYRRAEIQRVAEHIINNEISFLAGVGLYHRLWLQEMLHQLENWIRTEIQQTGTTTLPQTTVVEHMRAMRSVLATCEESVLHMLLANWEAVHIEQASIFEAHIALNGHENDALSMLAEEQALSTPPPPQEQAGNLRPTTTPRIVKERRATSKKKSNPSLEQEALWDIF